MKYFFQFACDAKEALEDLYSCVQGEVEDEDLKAEASALVETALDSVAEVMKLVDHLS